MVKTFSDNLEPITVELIDKNGNKITKEARFLSLKECKEISRMFQSAAKDETGEGSFNIIQEQMAYIFGGTKEEYEKYSPKLIRDVLSYITDEIINPTIQVQEK